MQARISYTGPRFGNKFSLGAVFCQNRNQGVRGGGDDTGLQQCCQRHLVVKNWWLGNCLDFICDRKWITAQNASSMPQFLHQKNECCVVCLSVFISRSYSPPCLLEQLWCAQGCVVMQGLGDKTQPCSSWILSHHCVVWCRLEFYRACAPLKWFPCLCLENLLCPLSFISMWLIRGHMLRI